MEQKRITVALVMTCYNSENTIIRALESVERQIRKPDSFIIIDDASKDKTVELIEEYKKTSSLNIELYVSEENGGAGVSKGRGVNLAKSDYITFMDSDDELKEDAISFMASMAEKNEGVDLIATRLCRMFGKGRVPERQPLAGRYEGKKIFFLWNEGIILNSYMPTKLFRREVIKDIPVCSFRYMEDYITILDWLWETKSAIIYDKETYIYHNNEGSLSNDGKSRQKIMDVIRAYLYRFAFCKSYYIPIRKEDRSIEVVKRHIKEARERNDLSKNDLGLVDALELQVKWVEEQK